MQAQSAPEKESYEEMVVRKELSRRYDVVFTPDTTHDYHEYAIRDVDSNQIGHYVTIKGMVTRVGEMLPMVRVATYNCRECGNENYQRVGPGRRSEAPVPYTPLTLLTSHLV